MGPVNGRSLPLLALPLLAACNQGAEAPEQAQRISLEDARTKVPEPLVSPDTTEGAWKVTDNGQAIDFAPPGQPPLLTLACKLREEPATLTIVRHVQARPGEKALFPVIGNGMISRFKLDAALADGEWRWEGAVPASDPSLDVFTGPLEIEATLPGGGSLLIEGSRIPGEFVNWCRAGGRVLNAEDAESDERREPSSAPPAR